MDRGDNGTEKGNPLILYTGSLGQFLYLLPAKDEFMVTPNMDHFGLEVSSKEELTELLERVRAYQAKDDRFRLTEVGAMVTRYGDKEYTLTNAYIWFVIPLWIELQQLSSASAAASRPDGLFTAGNNREATATRPGQEGRPSRATAVPVAWKIRLAAAVRLSTPSRASARVMWLSTVLVLMPNSREMLALDLPCIANSST